MATDSTMTLGEDPSDANSWYAYGEFALDRILGVQRAEVVNVFAPGLIPTPETVRMQLGIPRILSIEISDEQPRFVCNIDRLVILPRGAVYDLGNYSEFSGSDLKLNLIQFDIQADGLLRLCRLLRDYPEVQFESSLRTYVTQSVAFLESIRDHFPELELVFQKYTPFTRWRAEKGALWEA